MAKILVIGDTSSPLIRERGVVGAGGGHRIFWVSAGREPVEKTIVATIPRSVMGIRVLRQLALGFLVDRMIRRVKPDLIHVHYALQAFATIPLLRFHPLIVSVMGGDILPDQGYKGYAKPLVRALLNSADCITSKSSFLDRALGRIGNYNHKIQRVTWGIDLDHFNRLRDTCALRQRLRIGAEELVFFDPRLAQSLYNKEIILRAFARYSALGPPAVLIVSELGGSESYLAHLRTTAERLGIAARVRFAGPIEHRAMADYYALSNVTISIPKSDGFPQTIYEAAACGSLLVLADLPQYREALLDGLIAHCIPAAEEDQLSEALLSIVRRPESCAEAVRKGRDYPARVANKQTEDQRVRRMYDVLLEDSSRRIGSRQRTAAR